MVVNHFLEAMNAQRNYNINVDNKAKSTEKLSSGYKINRAADNAAGQTISEKMRIQIRGLNKACDNVETGIDLVKTADGGLNEIHSITQRQRELLIQAANDTNTDADRAAIEAELSALNNEQDRIFDSTEFNTIELFKGKDTLLAGPVTNTTTNTRQPINRTTTKTDTTVIWLEKTDPVPPDTNTTSHWEVLNNFSSTYTESETVNSVNPDGHTIYDENSIYTTIRSKDTFDEATETTHVKQTAGSQYTSLVAPGDMTGNNGYINITNKDPNSDTRLNLSCAMSQLGVQIDGTLKSYDLYGDGAIPKSTVVSADNNTATTSFNLGNGIELAQIIELQADQSYKISYKFTNNDTANPHTASARLAFDTMNTQVTSAKNAEPYTLENDMAKIPITGSNTDYSVMGNIEQLYNTWDDSHVVPGTQVDHHTGAGFWWENRTLQPGQSLDLGSVTYGPIELKKVPYEVTTTTKTTQVRDVTETVTTETSTILPQYLDIQSSDRAYDKISIRLYDLSTDNLKETVGLEKPISAFHGADSLKHMDRVIDKISAIRSYYGAIQNRLSSTNNIDSNTGENVTASESRIRDTDMSAELVRNSLYNILQQSGQSILAQANQSKQGILQLLQ